MEDAFYLPKEHTFVVQGSQVKAEVGDETVHGTLQNSDTPAGVLELKTAEGIVDVPTGAVQRDSPIGVEEIKARHFP